MSDVRPFRALRYPRDPIARLAPPYDVLTQEERDRLAADPTNVVHLTLPPGPEGERDYAQAASALSQWVDSGVLVRDAEPALYALAERTASGCERRGLFALLRLADYAERTIFPHERTMAGPKHDRLLLTRAVNANLEPLFFVYEDRGGKLASVFDVAFEGAPLADGPGPDGTHLRLHRLTSPDALESARAFFAASTLVIADGHHRYETMLRYRDECRKRDSGTGDPDGPQEFVLAYLVNAFDPGTEILAIHRQVEGGGDAAGAFESAGFRVDRLPADAGVASCEAALQASLGREHAFILVPRDGPRMLARRERGPAVDVRVLHDELLPAIGGDVSFEHSAERVCARARSGEIDLGILMNPLPAEGLFAAVQEGEVLPQKSTYFAPKVPSGLLIRTF